MRSTSNPRIFKLNDWDPYSSPEETGDLTDKQFHGLEEVARLSPGYSFVVRRYGGKGAAATHVSVCKEEDTVEVGLVGADTAQYYDQSAKTQQVVKRVSHRVYRKSVYFDAFAKVEGGAKCKPLATSGQSAMRPGNCWKCGLPQCLA